MTFQMMHKLLVVLISFCSLSLMGCEKEDFWLPEVGSHPDDNECVLIFGNSYSRDAFSYVPALLEESGLQINITILCINGNALSTHYEALGYNRSKFEIDTYDFENHRWRTYKDSTALQSIISKDWKLVIMQDGGNTAKDYHKTSTNVKNLKSYLQRVIPQAHFSYMINPPHPIGHPSLNGGSNNEEYSVIVRIAKQLVADGIVADLVPCGTAIQNARQTDLQTLGNYGDLSYEGKHLQEGIPCMIEAYVGANFIADFFGYEYSIFNSQLRINQTWVSKQQIPGQHGKVVTGDDAQYELSKHAAIDAVTTPLQITNVIE